MRRPIQPFFYLHIHLKLPFFHLGNLNTTRSCSAGTALDLVWAHRSTLNLRAGCLARPRHTGLIAHPLHSYSTQAQWPSLWDLGHLPSSWKFKVDAYHHLFVTAQSFWVEEGISGRVTVLLLDGMLPMQNQWQILTVMFLLKINRSS